MQKGNGTNGCDAAYVAYDRYVEVEANKALCASTYKYTNIDIEATASAVSLVTSAARKCE